MVEHLTDIEIQRLKHEGRDRIMRQVRGMLPDPAPVPDPPKRRIHPLWFLAGFCAGCLAIVAAAVIPGAFQ